jgi:DNA-binding MarR family transcriptional regulator
MDITNQEESTGFLLYNLTTLLQRRMKRELDVLDITHMQFVLLATLKRLSKNNKAVRQIEIATESKADKMMVSKVLRTLQTKRFVTREEHSTDTRAKTIILTNEGNLMLQKGFGIVKKVEKDFFECLEKQTTSFNANIKTLISKNQD